MIDPVISEAKVRAILPDEGFLATYLKYAESRTDAHLIHHVLAGVAAIAQTMPADTLLPFGPGLYPNVYILCVGPSGSRKTSAIVEAREMLKEVNPALVGSEPGSWEGLIDSLADRPRQMISYPEFGNFLAGSEKGYLAPIKTKLVQAYDCTELSRITMAGRRKGETQRVVNPRLSVIGACSSDYLAKYTDETDWTGGFMARFLLVNTNREKKYEPGPVPDLPYRRQVAEHLKHFGALVGWAQSKGQPPRMASPLEGSALKLWGSFMRKIENQKIPTIAQASVNRVGPSALKLASALAWDLSEPAKVGESWSVSEQVLYTATQIGWLHIDSLRSLAECLAPTKDTRDRLQVLNAVGLAQTRLGDVIHDARLLKKRVLEVLDSLTEEGEVIREVTQGAGGIWYRRIPR